MKFRKNEKNHRFRVVGGEIDSEFCHRPSTFRVEPKRYCTVNVQSTVNALTVTHRLPLD